jgi:AraC-like DNA-binding protein
MDVIAEWLSAARVSGTVFSRSELSEPWGLEYPAAPRIAFHIISRGRAYLRLSGRSRGIVLGQGDIVLLGSGQGHVLASSPNGPAENLLGYLSRHPLGRDRTIRHGGGGGAGAVMICGAYAIDQANAGALLSLLPKVIHLPAELTAASPVQATLQLLLSEMTLAEVAGDAVLSRLVDVLLIYVLRAWAMSRPEGSHGWLSALRDPRIACTLARLHEQPAHGWTVESLAAEAGMSRSAFARSFADLVGEAPLAYLTRWRMTLAARLLTDTTLPIAEIASKVGYTSEYAFNRAFSRVRRTSPGRWRAGNSSGESRVALPEGQ